MTDYVNVNPGDHTDAETHASIDVPEDRSAPTAAAEFSQWRIVVVEFVHLLGLFLRHARQAKSARATSVLFEQMLRHLKILERMPGHNGFLVICQNTPGGQAAAGQAAYQILFGDLTLQGDRDALTEGGPIAAKRLAQLSSGLQRTFEFLADQQIHRLVIELPGVSVQRTDQLRLALNIAARYHAALKKSTSITFRYHGRALTIPLIRDTDGTPDPNLTLVAGLNSLSNLNARSLINQAEAYCQMVAEYNCSDLATATLMGNYNQIFQARSLRAQIIRPPVEINNPIPYPAPGESKTHFTSASNTMTTKDEIHGPGATGGVDEPMQPITVSHDAHKEAIRIDHSFLADWIDVDDPKYESAFHAMLDDRYAQLNTTDIGRRLAAVSGLIHAVEKKCQDPAVIDRILFALQDRLIWATDDVLANIHVQNQGLKLFSNGRVVIAGLMHPRLIDLVSLVKDKVVTRQKFETVKRLGFDFKRSDIHAVTRAFKLPSSNAHHLMDLLKSCFDTSGGFNRDVFESHIESMAPQADTLFEMLWCFLKLTPRRKDRLAFVNAIPLLMTRLKDSGRALRFILDDLCQDILQIDFSDRNALVLANILLRTENKELYIDLQRTPEHVLDQAMDENTSAKRYIVWRLNTDNIRIVTKFKTIHMALIKAIKAANEMEAEPQETQYLFALEREVLIFMSLAGSMTARGYLHHALLEYGDSSSEIYQYAYIGHYLSQLINHLRIVIRGFGCLGELDDIAVLMVLKSHVEPLSALATHPAQALAVKRAFKWVDTSIKAIQKRNQMVDSDLEKGKDG